MNKGFNVAQGALLVIRKNDDINLRQMCGETFTQCCRIEAGKAVFKIQPEQLLIAAQHPQFGNGRLAGLAEQFAQHAQSVQFGFQNIRRLIRASDAQHPDVTAQGRNVDCDISRAAGSLFNLFNFNNRNRRFRRHPERRAVPVAIQHDVADDEDAGLFKTGNFRFHGWPVKSRVGFFRDQRRSVPSHG